MIHDLQSSSMSGAGCCTGDEGVLRGVEYE